MIYEIKKILVCDTNRYFFNLLRKEFSQFDFIYYSDKEKRVDYDFVIFLKNRSLECFEFLEANKIRVPIIVAVFDEVNIYLKCQLWEKGVVSFIKTSNTKTEIKNQLKTYFETRSKF
ncbi:hypothetical protein [Flavobacterium sp.]|uniref:hypothetical protein n=1 Tax=Flavobacterium sp. TaxID=239 RepID=UPI0026167D8F|nr:hypothetical protein [Flavobacterium sp.]